MPLAAFGLALRDLVAGRIGASQAADLGLGF